MLDNHSECIQYAGLTQNTGRIIVLDLKAAHPAPSPVSAFYIREQYVLAHTNNVDIVINDRYEGSKLLKGNRRFYKTITKR
jgi:hypothetical protein